MILIIPCMIAFAVVHSLTAGDGLKHPWIKLFGERSYHGFYRLFYNILSIATIAPVVVIAWSGGNILYQIPSMIVPLFQILQLIGAIGLAISILQIDWARFAGLKQFIAYFKSEPLPLSSESLKTNGLYGFVRHPLYFFSLFTLWFGSEMTDQLLVFNFMATAYFLIGSWIEEHRMVRMFGQEYRDYQNRVPWLFSGQMINRGFDARSS